MARYFGSSDAPLVEEPHCRPEDSLNMQNECSQHSQTRNLHAHNLSLHPCQVLMLTQFLALIIS